MADNELIKAAIPIQAIEIPTHIGSVVAKAITRPETITPKDTAAKAGRIAPVLFFMLSIADFMDVFMRSQKFPFGFVIKVLMSLFLSID